MKSGQLQCKLPSNKTASVYFIIFDHLQFELNECVLNVMIQVELYKERNGMEWDGKKMMSSRNQQYS